MSEFLQKYGVALLTLVVWGVVFVITFVKCCIEKRKNHVDKNH